MGPADPAPHPHVAGPRKPYRRVEALRGWRPWRTGFLEFLGTAAADLEPLRRHHLLRDTLPSRHPAQAVGGAREAAVSHGRAALGDGHRGAGPDTAALLSQLRDVGRLPDPLPGQQPGGAAPVLQLHPGDRHGRVHPDSAQLHLPALLAAPGGHRPLLSAEPGRGFRRLVLRLPRPAADGTGAHARLEHRSGSALLRSGVTQRRPPGSGRPAIPRVRRLLARPPSPAGRIAQGLR